jgi:hypothetical protein
MIARTPRTLPCYLDFDGYCDACGDARHECKDTHMGHICSACRTLCAFCGDWLLLDSIALDNQNTTSDALRSLQRFPKRW